jgi:hypothetical protein
LTVPFRRAAKQLDSHRQRQIHFVGVEQ